MKLSACHCLGSMNETVNLLQVDSETCTLDLTGDGHEDSIFSIRKWVQEWCFVFRL